MNRTGSRLRRRAASRQAFLAGLVVRRLTPRLMDAMGAVLRGRGIALALIRAAVAYAAKQGAPAVEAYPRAGAARTADDNAYIGTEPLFRRAGFRVIRKASGGGNRVRRVTMRKPV